MEVLWNGGGVPPPPRERAWDQWKYYGMEILWNGDGGTRPPDVNRQTRVKTLPSFVLRTRVVTRPVCEGITEYSKKVFKKKGVVIQKETMLDP